MNLFRTLAGRALALFLILAAVTLSGCNRVSSDTATLRYQEAIGLEKQGNWDRALEAYRTASQGRFKDQAQSLASMARVALRAKRYDVAVQAYTTLSQQFPDARVNAAAPDAPEDVHNVREWLGTPGNQPPDSPLVAAQARMDEANRSKVPYRVMDSIVSATGRNPAYSYFILLLLITVALKLVLTPLTISQFHSMRKMTSIQPKLKALQEQYKDTPEEFNRRMLGLYREEGVNPFGCGASLIIQMPIMFGVYSFIQQYNYQFRNGHFLWVNPTVHDLAPAFIGANLAQPDIPLLVLYTLSMILSQKLTMIPAQDDQQRQQQMMMMYMMPIMFLFILKTFPSAFILYWLLFNLASTWHQWYLMKKHPVPVYVAPAAPPPPAPDDQPKRGPARTPAKRKRK